MSILQKTVRSTSVPESRDVAMMRRIPGTHGRAQYLTFGRDVCAAVDFTSVSVSEDLAFEHLAKPVDEVWDFAMACAQDKTADHVASFVAKHQRDVNPRRKPPHGPRKAVNRHRSESRATPNRLAFNRG